MADDIPPDDARDNPEYRKWKADMLLDLGLTHG